MLNHPILARLSPQDRQYFIQQCKLRVFKRGEHLVHVGQTVACHQLIAQGIVRVDIAGPQGPAPTGFLQANDIVTESVSDKPWVAGADYVAVLDTTTFEIPQAMAMWLVRHSPEAAEAIINRCLARVAKLRKQLRRVTHDSIEFAIGKVLYELADEQADGKRLLDKRVTQLAVAKSVGLSREQVNKTMRQLQTQGLLLKTDEGYEVHDVFKETSLAELPPWSQSIVDDAL